MPYWDIRKLALVLIPVALLIALIGGGYAANRGGRLAGEELVAGWFCLGAPLIGLTVAAVIAILSSRKAARPDGYCPRCGDWLRGTDLFCPQCGASASAWDVTPGMKSDRARGQTFERPVSRRRRQQVIVRVATEVTLAAQYIVKQSQAEAEQTADLAAECLADPEMARKLYHAAARRLHPDGNEGVQAEAWNHLQEAMDILKEHHAMEEGTA